MSNIYEKLEEYKGLLNFKDKFYGKDLKNNYKFIKGSVKRLINKKVSETEIIKFLEDTIRIHKSSYGLLVSDMV